jgi:hypothetical protein
VAGEALVRIAAIYRVEHELAPLGCEERLRMRQTTLTRNLLEGDVPGDNNHLENQMRPWCRVLFRFRRP